MELNKLPSIPPCTDRSETNFFTGDPLRALSTLSYSDNVDLQRSAALAFAEITEKVRIWEELVGDASPLVTGRRCHGHVIQREGIEGLTDHVFVRLIGRERSQQGDAGTYLVLVAES